MIGERKKTEDARSPPDHHKFRSLEKKAKRLAFSYAYAKFQVKKLKLSRKRLSLISLISP
jgi:hypothetical protein